MITATRVLRPCTGTRRERHDDDGVIADDFTGATDIATAYAARGYRTEVITVRTPLSTGTSTSR